MDHSLPQNESSANSGAIEPLYTTKDVERILKVTRPTVMKLIRTGKLRVVKTGAHHKFRPSDVRAFISAGGAEEQKS